MTKPAAYQRWELASFDPAPPSLVSDEVSFEAELQRLRDAAREQGAAAGHVEGQALGYEAGFAQGYEQGLAKGRAKAAKEAEKLVALAQAFKSALTSVESQIAENLVDLALDIAQQTVRKQVAHDPNAIVAVAREVLAAEPPLAGAPALIVHPDDLTVIESNLQDELKSAGWVVRTDEGIERGGCQATAASGEVDATLKTRWERVAAALGKSRTW